MTKSWQNSTPMKGKASGTWVGEEFFLNNEMPERTRKNFMEVAFSARTSRIFHEIFSCPFVFLVVKNAPIIQFY
jgi:hypothetical protein